MPATNTLIVKDGNGTLSGLSSYSASTGLIPEHVITGTVQVTASSANPVYVTGAVSISQPVSVDVVVGDNIFVTSSLAAPLYVSSSADSPLLITGTVALQNNAVTASISGVSQITGTVALQSNTVTLSSNAVTASISGVSQITGTVALQNNTVTLSSNAVTASIDGIPQITGTVALQNNTVTASIDGIPQITGSVGITGVSTVTASLANPVSVKITNYLEYGTNEGSALVTKITGNNISDPLWITGAVNVANSLNIATLPSVTLSSNAVTASISGVPQITGTVALQSNAVTASISTSVTVTSSNTNPVIIKQKSGLDTTRSGFSVFAGDINWASTNPSNVSGTFILANSSSTRTALMFSNNTNGNLYIALGDNDSQEKNGFGMNSTASAPNNYSFILYPSGTYFADPSFIGVKHSGFFISSSQASDYSITVYKVE